MPIRLADSEIFLFLAFSDPNRPAWHHNGAYEIWQQDGEDDVYHGGEFFTIVATSSLLEFAQAQERDWVGGFVPHPPPPRPATPTPHHTDDGDENAHQDNCADLDKRFAAFHQTLGVAAAWGAAAKMFWPGVPVATTMVSSVVAQRRLHLLLAQVTEAQSSQAAWRVGDAFVVAAAAVDESDDEERLVGPTQRWTNTPSPSCSSTQPV